MTKEQDTAKAKKVTATKEKSKESSTREARIAGGAAGRKQKEEYLKVKTFALEREKANYSKLFLVHEKDNWWKMFGHSAVMFHYQISKWAHMSSRLLPDKDYGPRSEEGVVNIRDIYTLDNKLTAININTLQVTNAYRIYSIGKKFTKADIEAMRKEREMEWARVNKTILPKEVFPLLYTALRELHGKLFFATKSFDAYSRDVIGKPLFAQAVDLLTEYSLLVNDKGLSDGDYLTRVGEAADRMNAQMASVSELRLLSVNRIYDILRAIEKVKRTLEQCSPKKI